MIEALISSKTRIKLLFKFFLNSNTTAYLRSLEHEFGESTNSIRIELNRFEKAGLLHSFADGNKKVFQANAKHPLFGEIHNILKKQLGLDTIIDNVLDRLGDLHLVYITGPLANGNDCPNIDLILVGNVNVAYLDNLVSKAEAMISRKIKYQLFTQEEYTANDWSMLVVEPLLIWQNE